MTTIHGLENQNYLSGRFMNYPFFILGEARGLLWGVLGGKNNLLTEVMVEVDSEEALDAIVLCKLLELAGAEVEARWRCSDCIPMLGRKSCALKGN